MMFSYLGLSTFYLCALLLILWLMFRSYRQRKFSVHLLFSLIYVVTFFFGYPFSLTLSLGFEVTLLPQSVLFFALCSALIGYLIYYAAYTFFMPQQAVGLGGDSAFQQTAKSEAKLTAGFLMMIALGAVGYFLFMNGLLLFKLEKYSQIFAGDLVTGAALKRFFYFFMPALLIFYFLNETKKRWFAFLIIGVAFGALTYLAVGGTRANIALAFALFFFIGIYRGSLSVVWLAVAGVFAVVAMFLLALARYGLNVSGSEAFFTFLYLTRDTFSPWENFSLILSKEIEYQGLMPIVRDFYVFIPKSLWAERPDQILNAANYFTWEILDNRSGLAISPTILGSFYIMGGFPMIALGMALVGILLRLFDRLLQRGEAGLRISQAALLKAYCFANIFNMIVLVREGADAFFSRLAFFSVIFGFCWVLAWMLTSLMEKMNFIKVVKND